MWQPATDYVKMKLKSGVMFYANNRNEYNRKA
jgi:hypothetical protein